MHRSSLLAAGVSLLLGTACSDGDDNFSEASGGSASGGARSSSGGIEAQAGSGGVQAGSSSEAGTAAVTKDAPGEHAALEAFLEADSYLDWPKEAAIHASPIHGDGVRVFYGPLAAQTVRSGAETFPAGAATVKELWKDGAIHGFSVWVKTDADSQQGKGFYWYESFDNGSTVIEGQGHATCVGCHSLGKDYLRSERPFE